MIINSPDEAPFSDVDVVGIAISRDHRRNQNHIALLYQYDEEPLVLHVASHRYFLNENPNSNFLWMNLSEHFESYEKEMICAHIKKIADANPYNSVKYGLNVDSSCFDPETGAFKSSMNEVGLTCATFVLEAFNSCGFQLVNWDSWPKNNKDNIKWQKKILELIFSKVEGIDKEHLERQRKQIGNARYLPEEVAASTQFEGPVNKASVKKPSLEIRKALVNHSR